MASMRGSQKAVPFISKLSRDDLLVLRGLIEDGSVTPAIDRRYALSEAAETLRYLGEGHPQGKVVITV
ncbi:MAG TPA: zinc-binding dehydrogenase [Dehalococcoidia bacterium]|nr:zinc-binding dehydrogenase [Dehalococcoidia bacterium]